MEQLQKLLARAGVGSRRACAEIIKRGRVRVDGTVVRHPGARVDPVRARVAVDGRTIGPVADHAYLLLNKPRGYLSTRRDPRGRKTVMALLDESLARVVYPVGRLDRDASGLMLFTNDGELAHRLLHPKYHIPRAYEVEVAGDPSQAALRKLAAGVELSDGMTLPAKVRVHRRRGHSSVLKVTLREGRKNQVKRMLDAVGHPVLSLRRVAFGPLHLGRAAPGASRPLRPTEIRALKEAVGLTSGNVAGNTKGADVDGGGVVPRGGDEIS
jgi:23S rRNA pseudouridine2605 synthase